jgi:membrane-bound lytic murein transglycosylase B
MSPNFRLRIYSLLPLLAILALGACSSTPTEQTNAQQTIVNQADDAVTEASYNQSLNALLNQVSQTQEIPIQTLEMGFLDAKTIPSIRKLVLPPSGTFKKNWLAYRKRFIEPVRLKAGRAFLEENQAFLAQVEQNYGVPTEVITAIIGIETIYGRQTGNFRVKDVLSTLAFSYPDAPNKPAREQLFRDQLQELILLCWNDAGGQLPAKNSAQGLNVASFKSCLNQNSSYAGAIGLPQFMPSSIRNFAVDGDGDGRIRPKTQSQRRYYQCCKLLKKHGWQTGMPISFSIQESGLNAAKELADGEPQLKHTIAELIEKGILSPQQGDLQLGGVEPQSKGLIIDLPYPDQDGVDQAQYFVGLNNFLTIVQYNRSYFYAQSVAEFAEALGYKNQSVVPVESSQKLLAPKALQKKPKAKAKNLLPRKN